jgi:hypothetical protein
VILKKVTVRREHVHDECVSASGDSFAASTEMRQSMKKMALQMKALVKRQDGMELVQVAILVAIAILIGLIFRTQIQGFVNDVFRDLTANRFSK